MQAHPQVRPEYLMTLQLTYGITEAGQRVGLVASNVSPPIASTTASDLDLAVAVSVSVLCEISPEALAETMNIFAERAARTSDSF